MGDLQPITVAVVMASSMSAEPKPVLGQATVIEITGPKKHFDADRRKKESRPMLPVPDTKQKAKQWKAALLA